MIFTSPMPFMGAMPVAESREDSRVFTLLSLHVVSVGVDTTANSLVSNESTVKYSHSS